jgi:YVTN family beta-propeller protein
MLRRVAVAAVLTLAVWTPARADSVTPRSHGAAAAPAKPPALAYVVSPNDSELTVFNTKTKAQVNAAAVVGNPSAAAIAPNGKVAYVPIGAVGAVGRGSMAVMNTRTNQTVAAVPVAINPTDVAVSPSGAYTYVTNLMDPTAHPDDDEPVQDLSDSSVSIIRTLTNKVVTTVGVGYEPTSVAFTPNGRYAYVVSGQAALEPVTVIDTTAAKVVKIVGNGSLVNPGAVAIHPNGEFAYITDLSQVAVISTATNQIVTKIALAGFAAPMAVSPDGRLAYVPTNHVVGSGPLISVLDTTTNTVVATIPVGDQQSFLTDVALSFDGRFAYVTDATARDVKVISLATNAVVEQLPVDGAPQSVTLTPQPPCGATTLERLWCRLQTARSIVGCGFEVSPLGLGFKGIKILKKGYDLRSIDQALRPLYRVYNRLVDLRKELGPRVSKLWRELQKRRTAYGWAVRTYNFIKLEVDLPSNDEELIVRDIFDFIGYGNCFDLAVMFGGDKPENGLAP